MQGTPPPQLIFTQPTNVEAQYGDGSEVWGQTPNQAQYQVPNQEHYQIPIQPAMGMGYYPTTNATVALVLSILGFVGCSIFTAIPGLIMANTALQRPTQCRDILIQELQKPPKSSLGFASVYSS